jgi:hypothetical protein
MKIYYNYVSYIKNIILLAKFLEDIKHLLFVDFPTVILKKLIHKNCTKLPTKNQLLNGIIPCHTTGMPSLASLGLRNKNSHCDWTRRFK